MYILPLLQVHPVSFLGNYYPMNYQQKIEVTVIMDTDDGSYHRYIAASSIITLATLIDFVSLTIKASI